MKGAIAAGHKLTAETGADVLRAGGNAVDACIAAAFTSWVVESTLTGPGGGGFLLVHRARDDSVRLLDFFAAIPGRNLQGEPAPMDEVDVEFDHDTSQVFRIGSASCAVPGVVAGLAEAHRAYGTIPWRELAAPAVAIARGGFELTPSQAYLHEILDLILRHTEAGSAMYTPDGEVLVAGDRVVMSDLADTIEQIAEEGADSFYRGELGRRVSAALLADGGSITEDDLAEYRAIVRRPVRAAFGPREFVSNPPPSSGGVLIGYALLLISRLGVGGPPGSAEAISRLVEVLSEQTRIRGGSFATDLYRGGLPRRLFAEESLAAAEERIRSRIAGHAEPVGAPGTTHIAVVDAAGNAASMTASTGSGSGVVVPGTGIQLNNMLGEYDLNPAGRQALVGRRLTSMMAPSVVLEDGRPRLAVGSAGSVRLRGAILQIVLNVTAHGMSVEDAIGAPRVHLEDSRVHCEGGLNPRALDQLENWGYELVRWRRQNLYFGGAAVVELRDDGSLAAAGDPRRGGHGVVV